MSSNPYLAPGLPVRRSSRCPACGHFAGCHVAATGDGGALYRCMNLVGRDACGAYFVGPKPAPLWRPAQPERCEAAA